MSGIVTVKWLCQQEGQHQYLLQPLTQSILARRAARSKMSRKNTTKIWKSLFPIRYLNALIKYDARYGMVNLTKALGSS